jgi:carbon monoxide dehydrogenase subunit G
MRLTGTAILHAPPGQAWAALTDPAVLAAAIPGCSRLAPSGPDAYEFAIEAGAGTVHGTYSGEVRLFDRNEPQSFRLAATGSGAPGTVSIGVRFRLAAADAGTELAYDANGEVGGLLAAVGQRLITALAQRMTADFFSSVDAQLQEGNGAAATDSARQRAGTFPAGTVPAPAAVPPAESDKTSFLAGAVTGTAAALAGVAIGSLVRRRRS